MSIYFDSIIDSYSPCISCNEDSIVYFLLNYSYNINFIISHQADKVKTDFEVYFTSYFGDEFLDDEQGNRFSESFYDQIFLKPEINHITYVIILL